MSERMTVHHNNKPVYDIIIDKDFNGLKDELLKINTLNKKICIVTESTVGPLYADAIKNIVSDICNGVYIFTFPAGESNKTLDTVRNLYEFLIINKFDRSDLLIALGGGVVGDLTGYTAATYLRGIDFIQIPTSLLSQVDSSVGGKTGVDFDSYKNMVGAFHQPKLVYTNLSTLKTLTHRQYISGLGEVVKAGLIKDKDFYNWLKTNYDKILSYDLDALIKVVYTSCNIKRIVVENDFTEKGERAHLNFGHTLGHAIEKHMDFSLLHGECVSLGMVCAAYLSFIKGYISKEEYKDIVETLVLFKLPIYEDNFNATDVINSTKNDKKMKAGVISFILLEEVGKAVIDKTITDDDMMISLKELEEQ